MSDGKSRHLGFWSIVLLGLNGVIGSGIFLLPGPIMNLTGQWSVVVYALVTLIVLAIAWCFAQCSALFNRNGGAYLYAKEAFGDFIGFEIGMMRWAVGILAWASLIVGFVTALSTIWPSISVEPVRSIIILGILGGLGLFNIFGIKLFKYINNVVTLAKLIPLLLFVLLGIFFIKSSHYSPLVLQDLEMDSFGSAALIIFYAFGGFEALVVAAGEMENPQQNVPLAVMLVIAFSSLLYFIVQIIAIGVLGDSLAQSVTPLTDAARVMLGNSGVWLVTIAMLISMGGINFTASFVTPRTGAALASDGMIPKIIGSHGRFGTPVWAILLTIGLTGLVALSGTFVQLVIISSVSRFAQYITTCLAVFVLRKKMSIYEGVIPVIGLIGIVWLIAQSTLLQLSWGLGALILGIPLYWLQTRALSTDS